MRSFAFPFPSPRGGHCRPLPKLNFMSTADRRLTCNDERKWPPVKLPFLSEGKPGERKNLPHQNRSRLWRGVKGTGREPGAGCSQGWGDSLPAAPAPAPPRPRLASYWPANGHGAEFRGHADWRINYICCEIIFDEAEKRCFSSQPLKNITWYRDFIEV